MVIIMYKIKNDSTGGAINVCDMLSAKRVLDLLQNSIVYGSTGAILETKKTAFLLEELPEPTQQKIYEKWDFWDTEIFTDNHTAFLKMLGFNKPVLAYDISYSHSDHARFSCDYFSYERGFLAKVKREFNNPVLIDFAQRLQTIYKKTGYKLAGEVNESYSAEIYFAIVEDAFHDWLDDYSYYLYRALESEYEYRTSFEVFAENCAANEWLFNEKGVML